jgi:hypothetical protein
MLSLFGEEPCRATMIAAQRAGLWLDMAWFIPAYSAFLALAAWALRPVHRSLALAAVVVLLLAGLFDEIEGVALFGILNGFPGDAHWFTPLSLAVHAKFVLLALGELMIAALLVKGTWLARAGAVPVALGGAVALWMILADPRSPLMMQGHRWAWTALLIVAIVAAIRPALVAGRDKA